MKKFYLTVAVVIALCGSMTLSSSIGSFALTNRVLSWNNQIGNKFVNELVFFAFWVLPVYEVTSVADLLVLNSIEFWSGSNPMTASVKAIDTEQGRYLVACDGKGYDVTFEPTGTTYRLDFNTDNQTWSLIYDDQTYPLMTMIDDNHVKMIAPDGSMREVSLEQGDVMAYAEMVRQNAINA